MGADAGGPDAAFSLITSNNTIYAAASLVCSQGDVGVDTGDPDAPPIAGLHARPLLLKHSWQRPAATTPNQCAWVQSHHHCHHYTRA